MDEQVLETTVKTLQAGGVVVVRTDTVYGIIALASSKKGVEKVYAVKNRDPKKQCITLLDSASDNMKYGRIINKYSRDASFPTSVIVPATTEYEWVLRGGDTVAYRVVKDTFLKEVIRKAGPVIAPSANPEGLEPARTVKQAREYFAGAVDYYVDGGEVPSEVQPSQIIQVAENETITTVRGELRHHHSAGGVVIHDGKVLLIHWDPPRSTFDFPKGAIEEGETSEDAAIREVWEETGYKARIICFIGQNEFDFQTPAGEWRHKTNDYYLMELVDEHPTEPARELYETFENVWVPVEEAEEIISRDVNKDIFNQAVDLHIK